MKLQPKKVILAIDGDAIRTVFNKDKEDERMEAAEVIRLFWDVFSFFLWYWYKFVHPSSLFDHIYLLFCPNTSPIYSFQLHLLF